jgi:hypothetical protein
MTPRSSARRRRLSSGVHWRGDSQMRTRDLCSSDGGEYRGRDEAPELRSSSRLHLGGSRYRAGSPRDRRRRVSRVHARAIAGVCIGAMLCCLGLIEWASAARAESMPRSSLSRSVQSMPLTDLLVLGGAPNAAERVSAQQGAHRQTPEAFDAREASQSAYQPLDSARAKTLARALLVLVVFSSDGAVRGVTGVVRSVPPAPLRAGDGQVWPWFSLCGCACASAGQQVD